MMAKPLNKNMSEIVLKYKTGQFGVNQLARMYKVDKATISRYLKANGIEINQHAKNATEALKFGISELHKVVNPDEINQQLINNGQESAQSLKNINVEANFELANEVLELVRKSNPQFARGFQAIASLIIKRSAEILQGDNVTSSDINQIANAMAKTNDTLGVFPKMPSVAQQINIGNTTQRSKSTDEPINLQIEFIDVKEVKQ